MSDYTPRTEDIKEAWIAGRHNFDIENYPDLERYQAEFTRWLAQHEKELREKIAREVQDGHKTHHETGARPPRVRNVMR